MNGAPELQVALIGCGRMAEHGYAPALAATPGARLVAVADPDAERRARLVELAPGVRAYPSAGELLTAQRPDAAIVASPAATHLDVARELAAHEVPTLVEKPPAPDAAGARELAALQPAPWIGFNRRFTLGRGLERLREAPGGLVVEAAIEYRRSSWSPLGELGDAWLDLGPHLLDLSLLAAGSVPLRPTRARLEEHQAAIELEGDGVNARIGCRTDGRHRELLRVRDSQGKTLLECREGGLRGLRARVRRDPHPLQGSLVAQLAALRAELGGEGSQAPEPVLATAEQGVAVMELHDRARELADAEPPPEPARGSAGR